MECADITDVFSMNQAHGSGHAQQAKKTRKLGEKFHLRLASIGLSDTPPAPATLLGRTTDHAITRTIIATAHPTTAQTSVHHGTHPRYRNPQREAH